MIYKSTDGDAERVADLLLSMLLEPMYLDARAEKWDTLVVLSWDRRVERKVPKDKLPTPWFS